MRTLSKAELIAIEMAQCALRFATETESWPVFQDWLMRQEFTSAESRELLGGFTRRLMVGAAASVDGVHTELVADALGITVEEVLAAVAKSGE